jgi:hypothetical protein
MKNRRIGQSVVELANRAKLADPLVQYTRIRESDELANPVLQSQIARMFYKAVGISSGRSSLYHVT